MSDPLLTLYSATGVMLTSDDDSGTGLNSLITFTATTTGVHYLQVGAYSSSYTGEYVVAAEVVAPPSPLDSITWNYTAPSVINVYYVPGGATFNDGSSMATDTWTALAMQQANRAFDAFENVCNVQFNIVNNPALADFFMVSTDDAVVDGLFGYWNVGGGSFTLNGTTYSLDGAGIYNNDEWIDGGLNAGGIDYVTLVHELGHGMGLAHPHDNGGGSTIMNGVTDPFDSFGAFGLNQGIYTMMSYNDGWQLGPSVDANGNPPTQHYGYQATLMAFDIAVLIDRYGPNTTYNKGNNTYTLPGANAVGTYYSCIYDTGGIDQIVYGGSLRAIINLNTATLDYSATGGGIVSYASGIHGGFTIANGVVIENASGGSGGDTITGNAAANRLLGNGGNDTINGGAGNDNLQGGTGTDTLNGGIHNDKLYGQDGNDTLDGSGGNDIAFGGTGNDNIVGGTGNDLLNGNAGIDIINGGDGIDRIYGGGGNDDLTGGTGNDTIYGQSEDDKMYGSIGNDLLNGGGGNDTMYGNDGADNMQGGAGNDILYGGTGIDNMHGGTGNDRLEGNSDNDTLNGYHGADILIAGAGNDVLRGGRDNDTMSGQGGDDRFVFDAGWGDDIVTDFANNGIEKIDLRPVPGISSIANLTIANISGGVLVSFGADSIKLNGLTAAQIDVSDFLL